MNAAPEPATIMAVEDASTVTVNHTGLDLAHGDALEITYSYFPGDQGSLLAIELNHFNRASISSGFPCRSRRHYIG